MGRWYLIACLTLLTVMTCSARGLAQSAPSAAEPSLEEVEGRARFESGRAAFAAGRFEDALDDFRRAYRLTNKPLMLFNIGNTADRLRDDQTALEAFEAYLREVPDADNRAEVEGRIRVLRSRIPPPPAPPAPVVAVLDPPAAPLQTPAAQAAEPQRNAPTPRSERRSHAGAWIMSTSSAVAVTGFALLAIGLRDKARVRDAEYDSVWADYEDAYDRAPHLIGWGAALTGIGITGVIAGIIVHVQQRKSLHASVSARSGYMGLTCKGHF